MHFLSGPPMHFLSGVDKGCLRLHQLPTIAQATVIRDALGIRKRVEFGAEDLGRRRASMKRLAPAAGRASTTSPVPHLLPEQAPKISAEPGP
jgi:hypothetical protein